MLNFQSLAGKVLLNINIVSYAVDLLEILWTGPIYRGIGNPLDWTRI